MACRAAAGPWGPPETLEFFARAHGVDLASLLAELREQAVQRPSQALPTAFRPALADRLYKRFFFAGIAAVLTVGAGWGAWLLWQIARHGSFTAASIFAVNAHGQAQIYGWVGLFIMGFAYHAFPRFLHTRLRWVPLSAATFVFMLSGILLRSLFEPGPTAWGAIAGAALELAAVVGFAAVLWATLGGSPISRELPFRFVRAATFWFVVATALDLFHVVRLVTAQDREAVVAQVATYQAALRDLQIHGVAMFMIFGVALRLFPGVFQFEKPGPSLAAALFWPLNAGVALESLGLVQLMRSRNSLWAAAAALGVLLLVPAAVALALNLKVWKKPQAYDRSHKFLRASQIWLSLSLLMVASSPLYFKLTGQGFSHAWYGAARHAITVGFISPTIMGVAARVIPTLAGLDPNRLGSLFVPFALVNVGCGVRVVGQVATDFSGTAFAFAGVSGLLELTGLAVWGVPLAAVLLGRAPSQAPMAKLERLHPDATVAAILDAFPETAGVLRSMGFDLVDHPFFRKTVARAVTLRQACALKGKDLEAVMAAISDPLRLPRLETDLDLSAPVAAWIERYPQTRPVFARYGLETCCGGSHPVAEAARHHGLPLERLAAELAACLRGPS